MNVVVKATVAGKKCYRKNIGCYKAIVPSSVNITFKEMML